MSSIPYIKTKVSKIEDSKEALLMVYFKAGPVSQFQRCELFQSDDDDKRFKPHRLCAQKNDSVLQDAQDRLNWLSSGPRF